MEDPVKWAAAMSKRAQILSETARSLSNQVSKQNWAFAQYASRLEKLCGFFKQLENLVPGRRISASPHLLEEEISTQEGFLRGFEGRSALYLLMCSPRVVSELQEFSKRVKNWIDSLLAADGPLGHLPESEFLTDSVKLSNEDESLMDSLEEGMLDTIVIDSGMCIKLARQIAEAIGMQLKTQAFCEEIQKLRNEKSAAEARGGKVHALYLEQFLLILDRAILLSSPQDSEVKKKMTISMSLSGRDAPMLPLQSFICPITRDVMRDPVQIASGQTYEREAIERWFAEGNTRCPVAREELTTTQMKSNFALKQSIAEWRERNYEARLHGAARCLLSGPTWPDVLVRTVREVRTVCTEEPLNKYKAGAIGLITAMVHLVRESRDSEVRKETLAALAVLARDNSENQEEMVKEGIVELLVFSLTRQRQDLKEAVMLMKLLSENPNTAEQISHAQGAVVFLVTLLECEDEELNQGVKDILENVPISDESVIIMAEANLMSPLANRLVAGSLESRIVMARTLAGMHLPVASKTSLATDKVISSLLDMIEFPTSKEANQAALGALEKLTPVRAIAEKVVKLHGFKLIEQNLTSVKSTEETKLGAAKVLADLSGVYEEQAELELHIYSLLQMMGPLTPVSVQGHVLRAIVGITSNSKIAREKLSEHKAAQILLPLMKEDCPIRRSAIELFCLLGDDMSAALRQLPEVTVQLLRGLPKDPERISLLRIFSGVDEEIFKSVVQNDSFLKSVTGLLIDVSQDPATVEAVVGVTLKLARLGTELQCRMAEAGVVERLVQLLESPRSIVTRTRSALALSEFSASSSALTKAEPKKAAASGFLLLCLPWLGQEDKTSRICRVHRGECTTRTCFCLVKADAVVPLVALLKDALGSADGSEAAAAALAALSTLTGRTGSSGDWKTGCQVIEKAKGLGTVISAVSSGGQVAQAYAIEIVERMFEDKDYLEQYGGIAQMHIIYAAQTGDTKTKRIAGRILRRLELVHSQSNYFAVSATS